MVLKGVCVPLGGKRHDVGERVCKSAEIDFGQGQEFGGIPPQRNVEFPADYEGFSHSRLTVVLHNVAYPVAQRTSCGNHCFWANPKAGVLGYWLDNQRKG